jgi:hypothetical protein
MHQAAFLHQLQQQVHALRVTVETEFHPLDAAVLQFKPGLTSWSILECLEHLNRYSRFYNAELAAALVKQAPLKSASGSQQVKFSWLGRKSYEAVRPENIRASKTLRRMNPGNSHLGRAVLEEFLQHQINLAGLLEKAAGADLNQKAVRIEFFKLLKLKLGEAFQFVVAHEQRHVQQALRVKRQHQMQQVVALSAGR